MNEITPDKSGVSASNDAFVVQRSLRVSSVHPQNDVKALHHSLATKKGVKTVDIDTNRTRLRITYDAAQIGFDVIEKILANAGYPPDVSWWSRIKSGWYRYLDENARINAKSKGGACCSNPSDIYANRRK